MPKKEALPKISHLQFAVLDSLAAGEKRGKKLRQEMLRLGVNRTDEAFYQMMRRFEEAKFVKGRAGRDFNDKQNQMIWGRHYRLLENGMKAIKETKNFYAHRMDSPKAQPAAIPAETKSVC